MQYQDDSVSKLSTEEIERYASHLALEEIGFSGQKLLKSSSVLCIGSGGLGSPVLLYLAASGVGSIGIVDVDIVEDSNLQRQVIHGTSWIGKSKVESARLRILEINPFCKVDTFETFLTKDNALEIIKRFDVICDCTDNFPSRYLINDACVLLKKPNVYGSIANFEGQVSVFNLSPTSPNYRDLVPEPPPPELVKSCGEGGVLGVLPGLIGIIQATEVIKIITGIGEALDGRLLVYNALRMTFKELSLQPNKKGYKIAKLIDYKEFCLPKSNSLGKQSASDLESISVHALKKILSEDKENTFLVDVRTKSESEIESIDGAILFPLKELDNVDSINKLKLMSKGRKIYVHCKSGKRSAKAIVKLKEHGIYGINVSGGINAWKKNIKG